MDKSKASIDAKDREILRELQKNCKEPVRKIAKDLGLRVTTTYDRIRRMERLGIIKGYKAEIDSASVGAPSCVFVLVNVTPNAKVSEFDIAKKITAIDGVSECHFVAGESDFLLKIRGKDINQIGMVILTEIRKIEGVGATTTMAVMDTLLERGDVPV